MLHLYMINGAPLLCLLQLRLKVIVTPVRLPLTLLPETTPHPSPLQPRLKVIITPVRLCACAPTPSPRLKVTITPVRLCA